MKMKTSVKITKFFRYLNDGIGTPCAGHVSAIPNPSLFLNADESRMVENFGFESPIGSKNNVTAQILSQYVHFCT